MNTEIAAHEHLATLTEASVALSGAGLDPPVVLDTVAELLAKHVGRTAVVYVLAADAQSFELAAVSGRDPAMVARVEQVEAYVTHPVDGEGLLARCARSRRPLRVAEADTASLVSVPEEYRDQFEAPALRSLLFVPLIASGDLLGAVVMSRPLEGDPPIDDAEVDLACDIAELATRALANARLHRALAASTEMFETAFKSAPIGMALVSVAAGAELGRLLWVNSALVEVTGHDEAALTALTVDELFPEAARPRITAGLAAAVERDLADSLTRGRLLRSDGAEIDVAVNARAVRVGTRPARIGLLQVQPPT